MCFVLVVYLNEAANVQLSAMQGGSGSGSVSSRSELVHYLLSDYMARSAMRAAVNNVRTLNERESENKVKVGARMNEAAKKCGIALGDEDKITCFVDGLHLTIQCKVLGWRESQQRQKLTFSKLLPKARDAVLG